MYKWDQNMTVLRHICQLGSSLCRDESMMMDCDDEAQGDCESSVVYYVKGEVDHVCIELSRNSLC